MPCQTAMREGELLRLRHERDVSRGLSQTHHHAAETCTTRVTVAPCANARTLSSAIQMIRRLRTRPGLEGVAARYHGALSEQRMLSAAMQRIATFPTASFAEAFLDDLTASGRRRARIE